MRIRSTRDWIAEVEQSSDLPPWVKRVLVEYGQHMNRSRVVSRPRVKIADALGISERAVTKALTHAKKVGFVVVINAGQRGATAVYQGTFAAPKTVREQREPISQHVDVSSEVPASDCRAKVGSRQYKHLRSI